MGTQNNGNQVLTFDYKQAGTSQGFNRLFHNVLPIGILKGGELARVTDASVTLSPMVAMFEDKQNKVTVRMETTEEATIGVSTLAPYIVAKFKWLNIEDNFVDFEASEYSETLEEEGLIIGKCLFNVGKIVGFDYSRKSWSQDHFWIKDHLDFRVVPNEPEDTSIKVEKGSAIIGGKKVEFKGGTKTINTIVSLQRIDLVSINKEGKIIITEGIQSEKPEIPEFPNDMLTVGIIRLPSNPQKIRGDMIESLYSMNYNQPSADLNLAEIITSDTSVKNVQEDTKYIIEGSTKSLTLDNATYKGCIVQVYANTDGAKLLLKHPNKIYKLTKGEYVHLIWNGIDFVDIGQSTTWDLSNTPYSIPLSADLNNYKKAGTWKNEKMKGIKHIPTLVTQAEESSSDGKSYCTLIVEEGEGWIKQYIRFTNTTTAQGNGSGHYEVTRGGLVQSSGDVQWQEEWSCKVDEANRDSAGNVITTTYATKSELSTEVSSETSRATQRENAIESDLSSHKSNRSNPHEVTKSQVGLGNVENHTDNELKQMIFDMVMPVGYVIMQLPTEPSPSEMYNKDGISSTWYDFTASYDAFYPICSAYSEVGTKGNPSLPNIKGSFQVGDPSQAFVPIVNGKGVFSTEDATSSFDDYYYHDPTKKGQQLNFSASSSSSIYQDGAGVNPYNVSVRLWRRV